MSPSASTRHQPLATRHSGCAAIPLPANPVLLSKIHPKFTIVFNPPSKIQHSKSVFILELNARTFVLGATRAQQLLAVLQ
jgi:hypothetical protein